MRQIFRVPLDMVKNTRFSAALNSIPGPNGVISLGTHVFSVAGTGYRNMPSDFHPIIRNSIFLWGPEGGLVELFKSLLTVAGKLFEQFLIQLDKQGTDALIGFSHREEGVVAQTRQDPSFDELYAHLLLRFIFRFIGTRRDHRNLVVRGELPVTGIQMRVITTGIGDAAFQVIRDNNDTGSSEEFKGPHGGYRGGPTPPFGCNGKGFSVMNLSELSSLADQSCRFFNRNLSISQ